MEIFETIKKYYKPIQPAVKTESSGITYREIPPPQSLSHLIYCFWQLKANHELDESFIYRVVSDGCIDIFMDINQPAENYVMGFCRKFTTFELGKSFDYIGVRFFPSAFPLMFGVDAQILSNRSVELKSVLPELDLWLSAERKALNPLDEMVQILSAKLTLLVSGRDLPADERFYNALNVILEKHGCLDTEKELDTGLSPRQLRRIFNFYIGTTPKTFSNVVRFQHVLNARPSKQKLKQQKLYLDAGFFDQAHFIKDFKTFYGVSPREAFD